MSVPTTGEVRLSQLQNVFGGSNPIFMSEYYTNATPSYTLSVSGIPSMGSTLNISGFRGKSKFSNLTKIVNGETYTLIMAHKAYNYPVTTIPTSSDTFFRSMFSQGYNTSMTSFDNILTLTDGNNYVNSSMFTKTVYGYLLESYNADGTKFPSWGSFETPAHTWGSLGTAGAVYKIHI